MNTYFSVNKNMNELIKIEKIEVDRVVQNTLEELTIDCPNPKKTRGGVISSTGKLDRMEDMNEAFDYNITLPPVKLKRHETFMYIPPQLRDAGGNLPKITYSILDGRHRVAASIINGFTHVPAIIF